MMWMIALVVSTITAAEPATPKMEDLRFMQGVWVVESGGVVTEEYWTSPRGGLMLGAGRTIKGEKAVFFEFFRIEQRGSDLFYVAQPRGNPPTDFKLASFDGRRAVFENPVHDFPNRVVYEKVDDETLKASIEGVQGGKPRVETWDYKRAN